jgi:iron complex transport system permease protein
VTAASTGGTRHDGLLVLRLAGGAWSTRVHLRSVAVTAALVVAGAAAFVWSLAVGDFPVPFADVVTILLGGDVPASDFIVRDLRLPRALVGVLVGAAFGVSGAVFQRLTRNPLASPDLIGINAGAAAAAVFVIVVSHGSGAQVTTGALAGAGLTALAIYGLAYRHGVSGYRLVLVGIGFHAGLTSLTQYLLTRAEIHDAQRGAVWLTGSLNGRGWEDVRPVAVAVGVLVPVTVALSRHLRLLELGDDTARGLGARVETSRAGLLLAAVGLAAVATAAAGPIGFVALVAPHVARRLAGGRNAGLLPSAAFGALLVVLADVAARRLFAPTELPVGVATAVLGAPYLLWLLARANRVGSGG